jgi:hypothetical protein
VINTTYDPPWALTSVRIVPPPIDEGLQMLAVDYLGLILLTHVAVAFGFGCIKLREVSFEDKVRALKKGKSRGKRQTLYSSLIGLNAGVQYPLQRHPWSSSASKVHRLKRLWQTTYKNARS